MPETGCRLAGVNSGPKQFELEYGVQIAERCRRGCLHAKTSLPHAGVDISTRRKLVRVGRQLGGADYVIPVWIYLPEVVSGVDHGESIEIDTVLRLRYFTFHRHSCSS